MRIRTLVRAAATVSVIAVISVALPPAALAQFQNPLKAAKDAWKKSQAQAKQQQQQQQTQQPQNANQSQPRVFSPQLIANADGPVPGPDCCTAEAMKKYAQEASFLDIVGIKLGMSPKDAVAAVRAFNSKMQLETINAQPDMEIPGNSSPVIFPHFIVAHTVGVRRYPTAPVPFTLDDGSSDEIVMEFTTPPNPPLLAKVVRQVTFANGQPIPASTLLTALRKKYGQENYPTPSGYDLWVYGADGKLITRQFTPQETTQCFGGDPYEDFAWGGLMPRPGDDMKRQVTYITNLDTNAGGWNSFHPMCRPFTVAIEYGISESASPSAPMNNTIVVIQSPSLLYASRRSTHDWLQAKVENYQKQQNAAAKARTAPKF